MEGELNGAGLGIAEQAGAGLTTTYLAGGINGSGAGEHKTVIRTGGDGRSDDTGREGHADGGGARGRGAVS